ncbi:hypothetical protein CHLRE_09g408051v5 [Chlamydomonas reinhardtii]|uniref:Uncharacterized protein n=1 Tax=Chlamydomonas reinhardtii TaxID=3055 RepID=A0A2K3DFE8_CHLRE|nr:uncharacterized protein CHLRE_09g408051v5 [Chlamydomonas reinhardtii]PNW79256.1 hypothetical protein CHLRE_09g408051v5 [Chlamydomonas reinhardtii]
MRVASGPPRCHTSVADLHNISLSAARLRLAGHRRQWAGPAFAERRSRGRVALVTHATSWEAHPSTRPGAASGTRSPEYPPSSPSQPSEQYAATAADAIPPALPVGVAEHLESLGISPSSIDPQLLSLHSFAAHAEPSLATLATLNSRQRVATLVNGHPELLCVPLEGWLSFLTAYGVTRRDFFRLLSHNPDLFTRGSLFNAGSVIAYLQLAPAVEFLRTELMLDAPGLKALLCRCPGALCLDPPTQLAPRLAALAAAGFSRVEVCSLVRHNAALLIGDVPGTLQSRLGFLTGHCGFSGQQARQLVSDCPEVLSLSVANLRRKWRFLVERMHCGTQAVLAYPRYWSKSLLLDIGPRYSYVLERQLLPLAGAPCTLAAAGSGSSSDGSSSSYSYSGSGNGSGSGSSGSGDSGSGSGGAIACGLEGACELNLQLLLDSDDVSFVETVWRAAAGGGGAGPAGAGSGAASTSRAGATTAAAAAGTAAAAAAAAARGGRGGEAGAVAVEMSAWELAADFGDLPGSWAGTAALGVGGGAGGDVAGGRGGAQEGQEQRQGEVEEVVEEAGAEALWAGPGPDDYERFRAAWLETEGVRWSGVNAVGVAGGGVAGSW